MTAAMEDMEELPQELCHIRQQKLGPVRTSKVISLPSALVTRAKMEICSSMEKMAMYIGTKYSNKAAQEWTISKKIVLLEPA